MHLLLRAGGHDAQHSLWRMILDGRLVLYNLTEPEIARTAELMEKYRDQPMDLADVSLIAAAETLSVENIFTLDRDFHVYRLANGSVLNILP